MLEEHERANLAGQFIEALLQVPVLCCPAGADELEAGLRRFIPDFLKNSFPFFITREMAASFEPSVIYHMTDFAGLNFQLFLYRKEGTEKEGGHSPAGVTLWAMVAGPYLAVKPDSRYCEQILQENGQNLSLLLPFQQFCQGLPIVSTSVMTEAMRTAVKAVTGEKRDVLYRHYEPQKKKGQSNLQQAGGEEALMELLEERYRYEKLMLQEVAQGNTDRALDYYRQFSRASRSIVRTEDPIRTSKNLGFSLNTMLRKSAELAGIHPVYLDIISTNFAMLIENAYRMEELEDIKFHMIGAYCRFVRTERLDRYSPLVRRAVTYMRLHLAEPLTLKQIAGGIKVSPSYLSRIFNREMEESVSNYITRARVEKAAELLRFTGLPIQSVGAYVGFANLNYFSRCFRKYKGVTPTAYRNEPKAGDVPEKPREGARRCHGGRDGEAGMEKNPLTPRGGKTAEQGENW